MSRFRIDEKTRQAMLRVLAETDLGIDEVFTEKGKAEYAELLRAAFISYDEEWLGKQFALEGRLKKEYFRTEVEVEAKAHSLAIEVYEKFLFVAIFERMLGEGSIPWPPVKKSDVFRFDPATDNKSHFLALLNPVEPYRTWVSHWCEVLLACRRMGGDIYPLVIENPASEQEVVSVETQLGFRLPPSLRQTFIGFSAGFEFGWSLSKDTVSPLEVYCGGIERIGLSGLLSLEEDRQGWIKHVFSNPDSPYDSVWYNKLPIISVSNGDLIAIDLSNVDGPVIYLSHEGDESLHGMRLGSNFVDFMERWSRLGCVGPDGWQLKRFEGVSGIDPGGASANKWLTWLGLKM